MKCSLEDIDSFVSCLNVLKGYPLINTDFTPSMSNNRMPVNIGWNFVSISKLITAAPLKSGNEWVQVVLPALYDAFYYIFVRGFKLNRVSKWYQKHAIIGKTYRLIGLFPLH